MSDTELAIELAEHTKDALRDEGWHTMADEVAGVISLARELESALASERAAREAAESDRDDFIHVNKINEETVQIALARALAAEATIAQVRSALPEWAASVNLELGGESEEALRRVAQLLANADLSALARHDAEVWDEGFGNGYKEAGAGPLEEFSVNPYREEVTE